MELTSDEKIKNFILTLIQYSLLVLFLLIGPWFAKEYILLVIESVGIFLALWAIWVMNSSKINIAPRPRSGAVLITKGPYRLIRHPMYLSIILAFTPIIISHFTIFRFIVLLILSVNLFIKLQFEEGLLIKYFADYEEYTTNTRKLIPWIY